MRGSSQTAEAPLRESPCPQRVAVDGKFFRRGSERFAMRGVTYGTFMPREDGALVPERDTIKGDLHAMAEAGFSVVRTYTPPTDDLLDIAADCDLQILAGIYFPDWRYHIGASRRQHRRMLADAAAIVRSEARRLAEHEHVMALSLGNEIPADVLRWVGADKVSASINHLVDVVREEDPGQLVTYGNYPTAEYLDLDQLDFLMFNVYLDDRADLRRYLSRLQNIAGDRPLVLGEVGLHVDEDEASEQRQADHIDWQLEVALERGVAGTCIYAWTDEWAVGGVPVEGWRFGLTRADRSPRPALAVAAEWNTMTIADLRDDWPRLSVLICAYNAAATLDECLRHTVRLDYPDLEIIVIDDGSTDETASIARRYPGVRLETIPHGGLSVARNAGIEAASGMIVAYLDSDAYPTPEWPYYLVTGFDARDVGGAGGPNVAPVDDPIGAQVVARSPGGPVHVLTADDRAEHVPGCNMAFWRDLLVDLGGFDPIYTSAGDDVDICWKVLDRGWDIGFHPAALVWHHRRPGLRPYLRQQRGYGRSEALVEARHPDRFTPAGTARWRGRIYSPVGRGVTRQRIYRGMYGAAAYQSVYQAGGHALDLSHQLGVPIAVAMLPLVVLTPLFSWAVVPALAAALFLIALLAIDAAGATPPRRTVANRASFRFAVAVHHLLQPLVRTWGRARSRPAARVEVPCPPLRGPVTQQSRRVLVLPQDAERACTAATITGHLRAAGLRVLPPTGWEPYDARILGSAVVSGDLVTTAHPVGAIQLTVRRRLRPLPAAAMVIGCVAAVAVESVVGLAAVGVTGCSLALGAYRTGPMVRRIIRRAAA